jgi:hypothetical protein
MMTISIDEKIAKFWYDSGAVAGASREELDAAEQRIGLKLPVELRRLLGIRDGGNPHFDLFGDILLGSFRGVANKAGTGNLVDLYLKGGVETLPPGVVIFAADADAWFGLDYRTNKESPSVLHWSEYEGEPVQLAPTFRAFLENLSNG